MTMLPDALDLFIYFINERESVRIKKEAGTPKPWTTDGRIGDWRYCNINRNDDTETKWIHANLIKGGEMDWFNMVIGRLINWHPTLAVVGYTKQYDPAALRTKLDKLRSSGEKWMTSAYIVSTNGFAMQKHDYLIEKVLTPVWAGRAGRPEDNAYLATWATWLMTFNGFSNFMANQVVTDLRYTRHGEFADDWDSFVLPGPGTTRGLNRLSGRKVDLRIRDDDAHKEIMELCNYAKRYCLPSIARAYHDPNNVSNSLCEFDKFMRLVEGTATPKKKYP